MEEQLLSWSDSSLPMAAMILHLNKHTTVCGSKMKRGRDEGRERFWVWGACGVLFIYREKLCHCVFVSLCLCVWAFLGTTNLNIF